MHLNKYTASGKPTEFKMQLTRFKLNDVFNNFPQELKTLWIAFWRWAVISYKMLYLMKNKKGNFIYIFPSVFSSKNNFHSGKKSLLPKKYPTNIHVRDIYWIINITIQDRASQAESCYLLYTIKNIFFPSLWIILDVMLCTFSRALLSVRKRHWNQIQWANWSLATSLYSKQ